MGSTGLSGCLKEVGFCIRKKVGSLEVWKFGNAEILELWKFGSLELYHTEVWKFGTSKSLEVWKFGSLGVWKVGSLEVWKSGSLIYIPIHHAFWYC